MSHQKRGVVGKQERHRLGTAQEKKFLKNNNNPHHTSNNRERSVQARADQPPVNGIRAGLDKGGLTKL
ncbi:hypothetical protein IF2G_00490 [Cordyceps javanica]|nr:hypothetical protein IF2G_00490 [Cordyceps javanica]